MFQRRETILLERSTVIEFLKEKAKRFRKISDEIKENRKQTGKNTPAPENDQAIGYIDMANLVDEIAEQLKNAEHWT